MQTDKEKINIDSFSFDFSISGLNSQRYSVKVPDNPGNDKIGSEKKIVRDTNFS